MRTSYDESDAEDAAHDGRDASLGRIREDANRRFAVFWECDTSSHRVSFS
jgi:hypothetical protein